jgi:two-component system sensor histidine kinase PilS (NtrC family)
MSKALTVDFSQSRSQLLTVQTVRMTFLVIVLLVVLIYQLLNVNFISFDIFFSVYILLTVSFFFHLIYILNLEKNHLFVGLGTALLFVWETIYVTLLIHYIGVNQSLLIFLYLINIILCGVVFQRRGGVYLALLTSVCFSILLSADPSIEGNTLYLAVGINNLAFFAVAYLSGYLSEQLNFMGMELLERGRDIRALKNLNSLIIDGMPSGLLTLDTKGQILQCNSQAQSILSPSESLLHKNIQSFIPPFRDLLQRFSGSPSIETQMSDQRVLRLSFSPLNDEKGQRLGSILLLDDVTHLKKLETRVLQSEKLAAIGQLAAGIAHEIRNPLASISGSVQLMQAEAVQSPDNQKLMGIAIKEIDRLNHLITEFLDYARPAEFEKKPLDLSILLSEVIDSLRLDPSSEAVDFEINITSSVFVNGHSDKLKQALLNIIVNALQAMEKTAEKKLFVELMPKKSTALLRICDTGAGISHANLKKIFEPFHTTKTKGTGLGLSIVHSILEAHAVQIEVKSVVGKGTEFCLTFGLAGEHSA